MSTPYINAVADILGLLSNWLAELRATTIPTVIGSQCEEDEVLAALLPEPSGLYLDIGASHPIECSNTWKFYERGWRGLLIEPQIECWRDLMLLRPGDWLWPTAVSNDTGYRRFRYYYTVSTLRDDWPIPTPTERIVPCERLDNILAKFPAIRDGCRLVSIDVEGHEAQVLSSVDWAIFKPEVLVIEYRFYDPDKPGKDISGEWLGYISLWYEEVHRTTFNIIFKRKPGDDAAKL